MSEPKRYAATYAPPPPSSIPSPPSTWLALMDSGMMWGSPQGVVALPSSMTTWTTNYAPVIKPDREPAVKDPR
jgi:hypothetical protein